MRKERDTGRDEQRKDRETVRERQRKDERERKGKKSEKVRKIFRSTDRFFSFFFLFSHILAQRAPFMCVRVRVRVCVCEC